MVLVGIFCFFYFGPFQNPGGALHVKYVGGPLSLFHRLQSRLVKESLIFILVCERSFSRAATVASHLITISTRTAAERRTPGVSESERVYIRVCCLNTVSLLAALVLSVSQSNRSFVTSSTQYLLLRTQLSIFLCSTQPQRVILSYGYGMQRYFVQVL